MSAYENLRTPLTQADPAPVLLRVRDLDQPRSAAQGSFGALRGARDLANRVPGLGDFIKRMTTRVLLATVALSAFVLFYSAIQGTPAKPKSADSAGSAADPSKSRPTAPIPTPETESAPKSTTAAAKTQPLSDAKPAGQTVTSVPLLGPGQQLGPAELQTADRRAATTESARKTVLFYEKSAEPGTAQFVQPNTSTPPAGGNGQYR